MDLRSGRRLTVRAPLVRVAGVSRGTSPWLGCNLWFTRAWPTNGGHAFRSDYEMSPELCQTLRGFERAFWSVPDCDDERRRE